jgi:hypothetical protein
VSRDVALMSPPTYLMSPHSIIIECLTPVTSTLLHFSALSLAIYIYTYIHVCTYVCIYIYYYRERVIYIYIYILGRWNMHRIYGEVGRSSGLLSCRGASASLLSCCRASCLVASASLLLHPPLLLCSALGCNKSLLSCWRGSSLVAGSHLCSLLPASALVCTLALGVDTLVDSLLSALDERASQLRLSSVETPRH